MGSTSHINAHINAPHPWGWNIYINYLELFFTHLSLLPILIYSSFILVWTHGYFLPCVIIKFCFISFAQIVPAWPWGALLLVSCVPVASPRQWWAGVFVLFVWGTSFLSSTARCSRLALSMFCTGPRISHFSHEPWFLLLENGVRDQDLGEEVFVATGVLFLLGPLRW